MLFRSASLAPVLIRAIVFSCLVLALAGCGGGGGSSSDATPTSTGTTPIETAAAAGSGPALSAEDCAGLDTVLSDIKIDSHTDWLFAHDVFPTDYERDRDTLNGLSGTSSGDELDQLGAFLDAYAVRSEERRVGKECSLTCRSRWSPYH